jgi:EAL and modified HD-GYP domain-containing signal transduction protein
LPSPKAARADGAALDFQTIPVEDGDFAHLGESGMNPSEAFPLIALQPVSDAGNAWVAMLLDADRSLDTSALTALLENSGLAGICATLPCVVPVVPAACVPFYPGDLPPDRLVLRMPVEHAADSANHARLAALRMAGFRLMVAGFPPAGATLSPDVESIAVTCPGQAMPVGAADWLCRLPGPHLALGTTESVCPGFCRFHWVSGHLAGHASPVQKGDATARGLLLKLLSLVATDADTVEIEAAIKRDPHLSYHLLKLVNSVAFAPGKHIGSFAQAIALLGRRQLQRWLQLLLYARPVGSQAASPLLPRAALRAGIMEGLARHLGFARDAQDRAFMVGMFSLLDALFDMPIAAIVAPLNLTDDVVQALVEGGGQLGSLRAVVLAGENGATPALADALATAGIPRDAWAATLCTAAGWAAQVAREA